MAAAFEALDERPAKNERFQARELFGQSLAATK
jgi:hypothetical protein